MVCWSGRWARGGVSPRDVGKMWARGVPHTVGMAVFQGLDTVMPQDMLSCDWCFRNPCVLWVLLVFPRLFMCFPFHSNSL